MLKLKKSRFESVAERAVGTWPRTVLLTSIRGLVPLLRPLRPDALALRTSTASAGQWDRGEVADFAYAGDPDAPFRPGACASFDVVAE